ncbi:unnamed protein product [Nippostrongylus brasiliensis]|uniref:Uncharacterized protein n=1 Tax=Nippostrongylus brasiliensis TaxID=27835 RepID=A0A0N4YJW9_NIPBR|nr:unnamed protein product [Nippostrongylus brasiliensis]
MENLRKLRFTDPKMRNCSADEQNGNTGNPDGGVSPKEKSRRRKKTLEENVAEKNSIALAAELKSDDTDVKLKQRVSPGDRGHRRKKALEESMADKSSNSLATEFKSDETDVILKQRLDGGTENDLKAEKKTYKICGTVKVEVSHKKKGRRRKKDSEESMPEKNATALATEFKGDETDEKLERNVSPTEKSDRRKGSKEVMPENNLTALATEFKSDGNDEKLKVRVRTALFSHLNRI